MKQISTRNFNNTTYKRAFDMTKSRCYEIPTSSIATPPKCLEDDTVFDASMPIPTVAASRAPSNKSRELEMGNVKIRI
jgi:hypothetical protein